MVFDVAGNVAEVRAAKDEYAGLEKEHAMRMLAVRVRYDSLLGEKGDELVFGDGYCASLYGRMSSQAGLDAYSLNSGLVKVFKAVFTRMFSHTVVVAQRKDDVRGYTVTIGRNGFGLRWHLMSRDVRNVHDIKEVLVHREDILKGLYARRSLWKWASVFKRFCAVVGACGGVERIDGRERVRSVVVGLEDPVMVARNIDAEMIGCDELLIMGNAVMLRKSGMRDTTCVTIGSLFPSQRAFVYRQLREEIVRRRAEIEGLIDVHVTEANLLLSRLKEEFKSEVFSVEL